MKVCVSCARPRPEADFHRHYNTKDGLSGTCRVCTNLAVVARSQTVRLLALIHYSQNPPSCKCCGETLPVFLTIDHIDGGGNKHYSGSKLYAWLRQNNYPLGFQVLCWNCNSAKHILGICPCKEGIRA